jgi:hypothetical protein
MKFSKQRILSWTKGYSRSAPCEIKNILMEAYLMKIIFIKSNMKN